MTDAAKLDKIYDIVFDLKTEVAKSVVHQENHAKSLTLHEAKIIVLEADRNKGVGRRAITTIGISAAISGVVAWIAKHFS